MTQKLQLKVALHRIDAWRNIVVCPGCGVILGPERVITEAERVVNFIFDCVGIAPSYLWPTTLWTVSLAYDSNQVNRMILFGSEIESLNVFVVHGMNDVQFSTKHRKPMMSSTANLSLGEIGSGEVLDNLKELLLTLRKQRGKTD